MKITVETVTPEIAQAWLSKSCGNRQERSSVIASYAKEMKEGRWKLNGDAIRFFEDGRLHDGHHRLKACVKAGAEFTTLVIRDLHDDVSPTVDKGVKRSIGDDLFFSGVGRETANDLAAAIPMLMRHDGGVKNWTALSGSRVNSAQEVLRWYEDNRSAVDAAIEFQKATLRRGVMVMRRSLLIALHILGSRMDAERTEYFLSGVVTGKVDPSVKDNTLDVREHLLTQKTKPAGSVKWSSSKVNMLIVNCLHRHIEGVYVKYPSNLVPRAGDTERYFC